MASETVTSGSADEQALVWVIKSRQDDFSDWDDLSAWMQADDRNAESFNRLALRTHILSETVRDAAGQPMPEVRSEPRLIAERSARPHFVFRSSLIALAASVAIVCVGTGGWIARNRMAIANPGDRIAIDVPAGRTRSYSIGDRATILVAGNSRLSVQASTNRVELFQGQALFQVRHDADHPLHVQVGSADITDLGTRFDVRHRAGLTEVAVSEGTVEISTSPAQVRLSAGQSATIKADTIAERTVDPEAVGAWRNGRLAYDDAPLSRVTDDLASLTGARIDLTPRAARLRFAGLLRVDAKDSQDLTGLAATLGVRASRRGDTWLFSTAGDATTP